MLKFLFWTLLLANAGLAAYQLGYLDTMLPNGHEPTRLQQQIAPARIRMVPPPIETPPAETPPVEPEAGQQSMQDAPTVVAAADTAPAPVCLEIGNFNPQEAQRFSAQLGELAQRAIRLPVQETASHMVYMPPQADREGAERKASELRRLGIEDFFIIQDNSSLRWGISLGVFKTEEGARTHLARLNRKGVRSARIGQRSVSTSQVAFQFRELDTAGRTALEQAKAGFARQDLRECAAAQAPPHTGA